MQVVHSYHVSGQHPKHRVISTLGRYDEELYLTAKHILRDMQRLERVQEVISEINDPAAIFPGKGHYRKTNFQRVGKKGH